MNQWLISGFTVLGSETMCRREEMQRQKKGSTLLRSTWIGGDGEGLRCRRVYVHGSTLYLSQRLKDCSTEAASCRSAITYAPLRRSFLELC